MISCSKQTYKDMKSFPLGSGETESNIEVNPGLTMRESMFTNLVNLLFQHRVDAETITSFSSCNRAQKLRYKPFKQSLLNLASMLDDP
mmetsp:Transcript_7224/g.10339  ORF Transcript_7224/g.10339 Transcript_7224/m.10339 type:complete len:88 (+) Transcript_7224:1829-2092(+)